MITFKIAYKVAKGLPNLPDGFIIDHFDTIEDSIEGYQVTSVENFSILFAQNGPLLHQYEFVKNQERISSTIAQSSSTSNMTNLQPQTSDKDVELFKQFLAWKAAQGNNS